MHISLFNKFENKAHFLPGKNVQKKYNVSSVMHYSDNRPETDIQRKLKMMANQSTHLMQFKVFQEKVNNDLFQKKSSIYQNQVVLQPKYKLTSYLAWNNWKVRRSQNAEIINQGFYRKNNDYVEVHYHVNDKTPLKDEFKSFTATFMEYDQRFKSASPSRYHYNISEGGNGKWDKVPLGEWRDKAEKNARNTLNNFIEDEGICEIISN